MPNIVPRKSIERIDKGMTKEVINEILGLLYGHSKPCRVEPSDALIVDLVNRGRIKGNVRDYFSVQAGPQIPGGERSLEAEVPYWHYINPIEGSVVETYIFRERDQEWRDKNFPKDFPPEWGLKAIKEKLKLERLPEDFFKALQAGDIRAYLYELVVKQYKEDVGSDAPCSPLRELLGTQINHEKTLQVLHGYVEEGAMLPFYKERNDEGFFAALGTSVGGITPFALYQYPEIVGDGEITHTEIDRRGIWTELKWYIDQKDDAERTEPRV